MAPGRGCFALAILLASVDIQLGGCMDILTSVFQEGKRLSLNCTVQHTQEEAEEGITVFLCKDKSWDCSPETSLEQLRLKREPGTDGVSRSSQLVFTINQTKPLHSGTYQCCARSQKTKIRLQGHFFSVLVTETGNFTVTGLKQTGPSEISHGNGAVSPGFLQEELWAILATSLAALQAL